MSDLPLSKAELDQLYIQYFNNLDNPPIVIQKIDGRFFSKFNDLEIPEAILLQFGMGVFIEQEGETMNAISDF